MSFLIKNVTGSPIDILDMGFTIDGGATYDLVAEDPKQIATSVDLYTAVDDGDIVVLDPLDGATELTEEQSKEIVQVHNDPHYRIRGGTLNQLEDVNLDTGSPPDLADKVLQWDNVDSFVPVDPGDVIEDASDTIQEIITDFIVDGDDTTVVTSGSPPTSIQINVNDSFLRNTGDTLDSGTLTIADGASIVISGDGGSGGASLTIEQDANATIETPTGGFTDGNQLINKSYADSIAAGFDPKESVQLGTTDALVGTTSSGSPSGVGTTITVGGASLSLDGIAVTNGMRVLIKDGVTDGTSPEVIENNWNGIYTVSGVGSSVVLTRATDQDGNPGAEVSGGNFTFIEQGDTLADTGWVVYSPDGVADVDVDDILWTQFTGAGSFTVDVGLTQTGNTIALDLSTPNLTSATPASGDRIAFHDADGSAQSPTNTQTYGATFAEMFDALDVPYGITGTGIIVRTGSDTYTTETIVASAIDNRLGIEVLNGDGVAGSPTVGLNIADLDYITAGSPAGAISTSDYVPVYDVDRDVNVYYTVADIAGSVASTDSFKTWLGGGNTTGDASIVADSSTDQATLSGGEGINVDVDSGNDTLELSIDISTVSAAGSPGIIDINDDILIDNDGTTVRVSLQDLIDQLGILNNVVYGGSPPGPESGDILYYDGSNWTNETIVDIVGNAISGGEGITVNQLVSPDTQEISLDICGLTGGDTGDIDASNSIAVCDGADTVKYTWTEIFENLDLGNSWDTINTDGGTVTADSPNDVLDMVGGTGISTDGTDEGSPVVDTITINLDYSQIPGGTDGIDLTDEIIVNEGGTIVKYTFNDLLDDLDIPNVPGTGIVVKTVGSPDTWDTRSIEVEGPGSLDGLAITNGDGVSGNPTVGLDIVGTPDKSANMEASDEFIIYNTTESPDANVAITGQEVADGVADILNIDVTIATIGGSGSPGQEELVRTDTTRDNKQLSVAEFSLVWSENRVGNNDWLEIANAVDSTTGYIMPMDATIVRITAHTADDKNISKTIDLYVDGALDTAGAVTFTAVNGENSFTDPAFNVDVDAGQKIRIRGGTSPAGNIQDVVVTIWVKWRV